LVVAASARPIRVTEFHPYLSVARSGVEELVGVWFLGAVGVVATAAAFWMLVLTLLPLFDGGCSIAIEELWRLL
jgi:hypothetical protein